MTIVPSRLQVVRHSAFHPPGRTPVPIDARIADLATKTRGVVTRSRLVAADISHQAIDRRIRSGMLREIAPHLFTAGHSHFSPQALWWAGVLVVGTGSCLIGASGAQAHGWLKPVTTVVTVGTPGGKPRTIPLDWPGTDRPCSLQIRRVKPRRRLTHTTDRLPTLCPAELLLGVAATCSESALTAAIRQAEFDRLVDDQSLRNALGRGRAGSTALRAVLDAREIGATRSRSALEETLRDLLATIGMPPPFTNVPAPRVEPIMEADFFYPDLDLVVEADGPQHQNPMQRALDADRDHAFAARGITVLRFTASEIALTPEVVAHRLAPWLPAAA